MKPLLILFAAALPVLLALTSCSQPPRGAADDLLAGVPADTPFVFVSGERLPPPLRDRLADHAAAQLASQHAALAEARQELAASDDGKAFAAEAAPMLDVLEALLAELAERPNAAALREIGIEPVTRSVVFGIGVLPAFRIEIADADSFNALLDRVEQRAGVSAQRERFEDLAYRRVDLGAIDAVLAVDGDYFVGGLLPDTLFERHLGLVLGRDAPQDSLADDGAVRRLIERHGFTDYGAGFVRLDSLLQSALHRASGVNRDVREALDRTLPRVSPACTRMSEALVGQMPRLVAGVSRADAEAMIVRGVWESAPAVAQRLQQLAAPVPGLGQPYGGMLALGLGVNLPEVRNLAEAMINAVIDASDGCEWVDSTRLRALVPQLNLALGPMTAGIKGFNLRVDDVQLDPQTLEPTRVEAALLAAVDDPRGVFALAGMFNPALAGLRVPADGTPVPLDDALGRQLDTPLQVAIHDRALLLLAGAQAAELAARLLAAPAATPPPLFTADYGIARIVDRLGAAAEAAANRLDQQDQADLAAELRQQVDGFRQQAALFERLRVSLYATDAGLVMEQAMFLR
jgi:hypothetical protein